MDNQTEQLSSVTDYIFDLFSDDATGHDFYHMKRVAQMARIIAIEEGANPFICELAGWVHDVGDKKLFKNPKDARNQLELFMGKIKIPQSTMNEVYEAINDVSFSKGKIPATLEGKIVQDADRLDAIGAIGIARVFAYGGMREQLIYHNEEPESTSIQHFYDKLLKLKDLMNTTTAKEVAEKRHQFMEIYIDQFFQEWEY